MQKIFLLLLFFLLGCITYPLDTEDENTNFIHPPPIETIINEQPQIIESIGLCGNGIIDEGEKCDGVNLGVYGNGKNKCTQYNDSLYETGDLDCFQVGDIYARDCTINYLSCNGPLKADFKVYDQVSLNPKLWRDVDLENEKLELGKQYRFDAFDSVSPNDSFNLISWDFGGTFASGEVALKALATPGKREIKLTVFDSDWENYQEKTIVVNVDDGIHFLSKMPNANPDKFFTPLGDSVAYSNKYVWSVANQEGVLGVADISSPEKLAEGFVTFIPKFTSTGLGPVLKVSNEKLYLKTASSIKVYKEDPFDIDFYSELTVKQLNVGQILGIIALNDLLFIHTNNPAKLFVYDFSDPVNPMQANSVSLTHSINHLSLASNDAMVFQQQLDIGIIDIRDPLKPQVTSNKISGYWYSVANQNKVGGRNYGKVFFFSINAPKEVTQPLTISKVAEADIPRYNERVNYWVTIVDNESLYLMSNPWQARQATKYSIFDPDNIYIYETASLGSSPNIYNWLVDRDGQKPFILQGEYTNGFSVYSK